MDIEKLIPNAAVEQMDATYFLGNNFSKYWCILMQFLTLQVTFHLLSLDKKDYISLSTGSRIVRSWVLLQSIVLKFLTAKKNIGGILYFI